MSPAGLILLYQLTLPRPPAAASLMVAMASAGAFPDASVEGFYISPEKEADELDFLVANRYAAKT